MMNRKESKKYFYQLTRETLESSSIHAIPNIVRNRFYIIKFVWFLFFLASVSSCGWFMYKTIVEYLNYETVSKTEIKYQPMLKFPIVSVCNLNMFNTDEENKFVYSLYQNEYPDLTSVVNSISKYIVLTQHEKQNLSRSTLNETILSCVFNLNSCKNDNDIELFFDPIYGKCFKFNSFV